MAPSKAMSSDPATIASPSGTHACVRCGAQTSLDRGLCETCNPLGLKDSASSQVHGTVFVAVLFAVLVLAVLGRVAISGVGPFEAALVSVAPEGAGLAVTVEVTNTGSAAGQTTCQLTERSSRSSGAAAHVLSPRIDPGERVAFTRLVTAFGAEPRELDVACSAP